MAQREDNGHPKHPIRNFFYTFWMVLLAAAFVGFWYGLEQVDTIPGKIIISACGALLVIGLLCGLFIPIKKNRNYKGR